MKSPDGEGKALEQEPDHGQQIGLGDALDGGDELPLGDDVDGVDVIDPLGTVLVTLVDGIDADIAG